MHTDDTSQFSPHRMLAPRALLDGQSNAAKPLQIQETPQSRLPPRGLIGIVEVMLPGPQHREASRQRIHRMITAERSGQTARLQILPPLAAVNRRGPMPGDGISGVS